MPYPGLTRDLLQLRPPRRHYTACARHRTDRKWYQVTPPPECTMRELREPTADLPRSYSYRGVTAELLWQYNDSHCSPIAESSVVSRDNYLLFFRQARRI